jgi:hypothetical protein
MHESENFEILSLRNTENHPIFLIFTQHLLERPNSTLEIQRYYPGPPITNYENQQTTNMQKVHTKIY